MKPVLLVIAGPNGSGKTTVTGRLRRDHWSDGVEYLNPDEVALERFGDWNSPSTFRKAVPVHALVEWPLLTQSGHREALQDAKVRRFPRVHAVGLGGRDAPPGGWSNFHGISTFARVCLGAFR